MNVHSRYPITPDEFVRWNENREGRREFVDGQVVELMINTTIRHGVLTMRLGAILLRSLAYPEYFVGPSDVAVRTFRGIRYPDLFVDRGSPKHDDTGLVAEEPVLLAEILSASSLGRDFVDKAAEYQAIPSLRFYLVASQDEARIWLWRKDEAAGWSGPEEVAGSEGVIDLGGLGLTIALAELYAGIERR